MPQDDDMLDGKSLAGRLGRVWMTGLFIAGAPVVWTLFAEGDPRASDGLTTRTSLEQWGLLLGFAVSAIGSLCVLVHWFFVHEPRSRYESYRDESLRRQFDDL